MRDRKDELLDGAIDYLTRNGVADMSLRPLAAAIGTSARMLIFHFASKENLLLEVLGAIQRRLQASLLSLADAPERSGHMSPMRIFWNWATDAANLPYLRLLYEVHFMALQNRTVFGQYLDRTSRNWRDIIEEQLPPAIRSRATATLCEAVFDGLVIDLMNTGDRQRTTAALDAFIDMLGTLHARNSRKDAAIGPATPTAPERGGPATRPLARRTRR